MGLVKVKMVKSIPALGDEKHLPAVSFYLGRETIVEEEIAAQQIAAHPGCFVRVVDQPPQQDANRTHEIVGAFAHRSLSQVEAQPKPAALTVPQAKPDETPAPARGRGKVK